MTEFLQVLGTFPTAVWTGVVGIAVLYWLTVIAGAADVDLLGGGDGGHAEGAGDGGHVDGGDGHDGAAEGALSGLLAALRLRGVPVTVTLTSIAAWAWLGSFLGTRVLQRVLGLDRPGWLLGAALLAGSAIAATAVTSFALRPLRRAFRPGERAHGAHALVGRTAVVSTSRVDAGFGRAGLEDGGAGLVLDVRCDAAAGLKKGDEVVIIDYDPARHVYLVEPARALLRASGEQER